MRSHIIFSLSFLLISFGAQAQTEFPLTPILNYSNGFTSSGNDLLEIGVQYELDTTKELSNLKFGARLPLNKDTKNEARIDKATDNYNLFLGGEFVLKKTPISKNNRTIYWGLEPIVEWGTKKFTYHPDSISTNSTNSRKSNYAFEIKTRYFTAARKSGGWQWGIFGRVRYSNSNEASDAINLVNTSTNIADEIVVAPPNTTRTFSPAFGLNAYPGTSLPFSFSPIFYYYWEDEDMTSGFEKERLRTEQWLYFYPLSTEDLGLRIGIGAFQDVYTKGKGDNDNTYGIAVSVKTEMNILKSIF